MSKPLVIYHGNCADGFSAAWVIWKQFGNDYDYHPGIYQQPPPDTTDRDVFLVDFSYKAPIIEQMLDTSSSVTILDHHKTAIEDLSPLIASNRLNGVFDLDRSGAMITWDYFNPGIEAPDLIKHVQDRDLWKFELEGTREIQANVFSYPYEFEIWDQLMSSDVNKLKNDGIAIERKHFKDINELVKHNSHDAIIKGIRVKACNLPYIFTSDAGSIMSKDIPFAFCYMYTPKGVYLSFRSHDNGMDVTEIARQFGGGGHQSAAGATISCDRIRWINNVMYID